MRSVDGKRVTNARANWWVPLLVGAVTACSQSPGPDAGGTDATDVGADGQRDTGGFDAVVAMDATDAADATDGAEATGAMDSTSDTNASDATDALGADGTDSGDVPTDAPAADHSDADAGAAAPTIYASTNTALYTYDPATSSLSMVGTFDCIGGAGQDAAMLDVAVDSTGALYGVGRASVYVLSITGSTVHCAQTIAIGGGGSAPTFYGLSMAPAGVVGTGETLLASTTAGELWAIDLATGNITEHGTFGTVPTMDPQGNVYPNPTGAWELSGDIVFGRGVGGATVGFVTLRDCPSPPSPTGCDTIDTLAEIDTTALAAPGTASIVRSIRGQIVRASTCSDTATGYGSFYGLALDANAAIGFSHTGYVVSIDFSTGAGCLSFAAATTAFGGAGVSDAVVTSAM